MSDEAIATDESLPLPLRGSAQPLSINPELCVPRTTPAHRTSPPLDVQPSKYNPRSTTLEAAPRSPANRIQPAPTFSAHHHAPDKENWSSHRSTTTTESPNWPGTPQSDFQAPKVIQRNIPQNPKVLPTSAQSTTQLCYRTSQDCKHT